MQDIQLSLLVNSLEARIKLTSAWMQRKEVAAWSAILFYAAILWSLKGLTYNNVITSLGDSLFNKILLLALYIIFALILIYLFVRLVHSQYAAIHHWELFSGYCRDVIHGLIKKKETFLIENNVEDDILGLNEFLNSQVGKLNKQEFPRIFTWGRMFRFLLVEPYKYLHSREYLDKNPIKYKFSNTQRQELTIYWLLIIIGIMHMIYFFFSKQLT